MILARARLVRALFKNCTYTVSIAAANALITRTGVSKTTYTYNTYGQVTDIITAAIDADGNSVSGTKSMVQSFQYNTTAGSKIFGSLHCEVSYEGSSTYYYYDQTDGKLLATVNMNSYSGTAYTYDGIVSKKWAVALYPKVLSNRFLFLFNLFLRGPCRCRSYLRT